MPDYTVFGYNSSGEALQWFRPDAPDPREAVASIPTRDLVVVAVVEGDVTDVLELMHVADIEDFRNDEEDT